MHNDISLNLYIPVHVLFTYCPAKYHCIYFQQIGTFVNNTYLDTLSWLDTNWINLFGVLYPKIHHVQLLVSSPDFNDDSFNTRNILLLDLWGYK